jgi:hypothetical protein
LRTHGFSGGGIAPAGPAGAALIVGDAGPAELVDELAAGLQTLARLVERIERWCAGVLIVMPPEHWCR